MLRAGLRFVASRLPVRAYATAVAGAPTPVTQLTEEEGLLQETVRKVSETIIRPLVREMDETATMDRRVINAMFENGLMGISTTPDYGGSGLSFLSSCIAIEELAKVDPSVSVMVDVQVRLTRNPVLAVLHFRLHSCCRTHSCKTWWSGLDPRSSRRRT
jgi:alkylation response protein AidB-like acyl-CoA dehydrogenase